MDYKKIILITGGAGFIGSHVVRKMINRYPEYLIVNLDKLTYAGNLNNLKDIEKKSNYKFENIDINNEDAIQILFEKYLFDGVIHLAAESHVDRSISNPGEFVTTNVIGTLNLLNTCRKNWENFEDKCFYHISTDEVYGSLGETGFFTRLLLTIQGVLILHPKQAPTILLEHMAIPMVCQLKFQIAVIIMVLISFQKN